MAFVPFFAFKELERVLAGLGLISLDQWVRLVGGVSRSILNRSVAQAYEYRFHWKETKQRLELRSL